MYKDDCLDNVLVQLEGAKKVQVWSPETVEGWRPRVEHKHWPGTGEEERRGKYKELLEGGYFGDVVLEPGDALFIPAMYFHSVSVEGEGWSVSANRYFHDVGGEGGWVGVMEGRKGDAMRSYEKRNGKVC